jgi:DNA-binding LacI/PurR family transcriptional regulator/DNA-binding transcriptional regulator YhcF (GntR family)
MNKVQTAYEKLKIRIQSGIWNDGERLPSLAELAQTSGVSRMTMSRALDLLRQESLLHTRGKLIICGATSARKPEAIRDGFAWERLKHRMGREILAGAVAQNELGPLNKTALKYGVSINTLKKALDKLVAENVLIREGRRYLQKRKSHRAYQPVIVLFYTGYYEELGTLISFRRDDQIVRCVERDCRKSGYAVRVEGYRYDAVDGFLETSATVKKIAGTTGFMLNLWDLKSETYWQRWLDLLHFLVTLKVPVVVIDQEGSLVFPASLLRCPNFRVLRISGIRAGEIAAEFLLRSGHRCAAYIAPQGNAQWAQDRYQGICRCFKQYGGPDAVVEQYSLKENADLFDWTCAIMGLDAKEISILFRERFSKEQLQGLLSKTRTDEWRALKIKMGNHRTARTIRDAIRYLLSLASRAHDPLTYNNMLESVRDTASNVAYEAYLAPFFRNIYSTSKATVWICSDGKTGISAISFLKRQKRKIPQELSVIDFDDWSESLALGLSTYNFNMDGLAQQAMLMIMDEKTLKSKPAITEVDGYVVERRTTRIK